MSANVVLHACAGGAGHLRVWLGVRGITTAPALNWTLDGLPAQPAALRPLQSVRSGPFLGADSPRIFAGLYEFPVDPNTRRAFRVGVSLDGAPPVISALRAIPPAVPMGLDAGFHLMLASCFYWAEDKGGVAGASMDSILRGYTPDVLLLTGDQVYLDLPPIKNLPDARPALARKFEQDYERNWFEDSAYAKVIHAAPFACVPDDHDYWNNFPIPSVQSQNTWTAAGRAAWADVCRMLYGHFQHVDPTPVGTPVQFDVDPLSFLLLDARSWRDDSFQNTMTPQARAALTAWVDHCIRERRFGVFATGQSLAVPKVGGLGRHLGDASMSNFADFPFIMGELDRLMRKGGDVILLTGDLHWSRIAKFVPRDAVASGMQMVEVICSPTSLVVTPGVDQVADLKAALSGRKERWPRHSDATLIGGVVELEGAASAFFANTSFRQRGNNVGLLSFMRRGDSLEVTPRFFPLDPGTPPVVVSPFVLRQR